MAFKVKNVKVDIDLDFSEFENFKDNEKLLKPTRTPSGQEAIDWAKKVSGGEISGKTEETIAAQLKERFEGTPEKAAKFIAENIDYWYGKGVDWWMENLSIEGIIEVFNFLIAQVFKVKKK